MPGVQRRKMIHRHIVFAPRGAQREQPLLDAIELVRIVVRGGKRVSTGITEVAAERRREEIARMLAGAEITDEARKAAERLIRAAG